MRLIKASLTLFIFFSCYANSYDAVISPLTAADEYFIENQQQRVNNLSKRFIGSDIRGNKTDIETLQRVIDSKLVQSDNPLMLQAMGAVLGHLLSKDLHLDWKVYKDDFGRSRALCKGHSQECLFPMTMISRKIEAGTKVDVKEIYIRASQYFSDNPFSKTS